MGRERSEEEILRQNVTFKISSKVGLAPLSGFPRHVKEGGPFLFHYLLLCGLSLQRLILTLCLEAVNAGASWRLADSEQLVQMHLSGLINGGESCASRNQDIKLMQCSEFREGQELQDLVSGRGYKLTVS